MGRKIILVFCLLLAAGKALGACPAGGICYVSNTAVNGYQVGDDTNAGTAAAPFLTVGKALATYSAGETIIINDGAYITTDGANGANYITLTKAVTINPVTSGAVTITPAANQGQVVYVNPSATGTYTLGALNLVQLGASGFTGLSLNNTVNNPTLILNGTILRDFTLRAFGASEDNPAAITLNGVEAYSSTTLARNDCNILALTGLASGAITINGLTATIVLAAAGGVGGNTDGGIRIAGAAGSTATVLVDGVTATISSNGSTASQLNPYGFIYLTNIAAPIVRNFNLTTGANVIGTYGVHLAAGCDGGSVYDGTLSVNWNGGYGIVSYSPGVSIYRNTVSNSNTNQGLTPHGITISTTTGGLVYRNTVTGWSPAYYAELADATTKFINNLGYNNYGSYGLYGKGATGSKFYNNTMISSTGYNAGCMQIQINGITQSTDVEFKNNLCFNSSVNPSFVNDFNDAGNTAVFLNNLYYASGSLTATSWQYANTDYATFADWDTAVETSPVWGNPILTSTYRLGAGSPAIDAGVATLTHAESQAAGVTVYGAAPDIGAYEYRKIESTVVPRPIIFDAPQPPCVSTNAACYVQ